MKFLNTDYPEFLRWLYAQHLGLEARAYGDYWAIVGLDEKTEHFEEGTRKPQVTVSPSTTCKEALLQK